MPNFLKAHSSCQTHWAHDGTCTICVDLSKTLVFNQSKFYVTKPYQFQQNHCVVHKTLPREKPPFTHVKQFSNIWMSILFLFCIYTWYMLVIQYDGSWQLLKQSTALTSIHPKCLHGYNRAWTSEKHNIFCIASCMEWSPLWTLSRVYHSLDDWHCLWNAFVLVSSLLCGRSCKWPPLVAFRFHSACYICAFQHQTTLLCLSLPALGRMVKLVTSKCWSGALVRARGVGHRGWDILSQPSEMPCRQPFIGLGENKPNCPPPSQMTELDW